MPGAFDIMERCRPGNILVYATAGCEAWFAGDNMANYAKRIGLGGSWSTAACATSRT